MFLSGIHQIRLNFATCTPTEKFSIWMKLSIGKWKLAWCSSQENARKLNDRPDGDGLAIRTCKLGLFPSPLDLQQGVSIEGSQKRPVSTVVP